MSTRSIVNQTGGAALVSGVIALVTMAPHAVTAKPKPLPSGSGEEGESKCKQCDDEFTEKAAKCMGVYDQCQAPCPACKTMANCEARKPCMAPCNIKFAKCKDEAFEERKDCEKGCK